MVSRSLNKRMQNYAQSGADLRSGLCVVKSRDFHVDWKAWSLELFWRFFSLRGRNWECTEQGCPSFLVENTRFEQRGPTRNETDCDVSNWGMVLEYRIQTFISCHFFVECRTVRCLFVNQLGSIPLSSPCNCYGSSFFFIGWLACIWIWSLCFRIPRLHTLIYIFTYICGIVSPEWPHRLVTPLSRISSSFFFGQLKHIFVFLRLPLTGNSGISSWRAESDHRFFRAWVDRVDLGLGMRTMSCPRCYRHDSDFVAVKPVFFNLIQSCS